MRIWGSRNTSTANSRELSPVSRLPSSASGEASATSILSATNEALIKLLPGFVQDSLAPIARGDTQKKSTSSKARDCSDVGSESSRRRLSLQLGWGAAGAKDQATPRESAAETREKRAARREMERRGKMHLEAEEKKMITSWLAKTPKGPDSTTA